MSEHWLTISVPCADQDDAEELAALLARLHGGRVVQVQAEPPQGATVVGDQHEDEL